MERDVDSLQFASPAVIGDNSILEARLWWADPLDDVALVDAHLDAIGARHSVFGHDPNAFASKGSMSQKLGGRLFLIDVGMSPGVNYSEGVMMLLQRTPTTTVQVLFSNGSLLAFYSE